MQYSIVASNQTIDDWREAHNILKKKNMVVDVGDRDRQPEFSSMDSILAV